MNTGAKISFNLRLFNYFPNCCVFIVHYFRHAQYIQTYLLVYNVFGKNYKLIITQRPLSDMQLRRTQNAFRVNQRRQLTPGNVQSERLS